ncbi:MAG: hypothetical protein EBR73_15775 [Rhodobacteraceae bacterium]|nr:hypothetical protein [Paracoccaceae bacterium]
MNAQQLDQQRADMMEDLYELSGRDQLPYGHPLRSTYTGLWQEFARDLAANFRDTYYPELLARVTRAMDATESVMTQKQAQQAIEVCRQQLLGDKWL